MIFLLIRFLEKGYELFFIRLFFKEVSVSVKLKKESQH